MHMKSAAMGETARFKLALADDQEISVQLISAAQVSTIRRSIAEGTRIFGSEISWGYNGCDSYGYDAVRAGRSR